VHIALSLAAALPLLRTPESRPEQHPRSARTLFTDLRVPRSARHRFYGLVLPLAPWVFTAPALAFVVGPALVADQLGGYRVAFAALAAVVTLAVGAAVQPFVPAITRASGGRPGSVGLLLAVVGTGALAVDTHLHSPALAIAAAAVLGAAYGICLVAGLVEVQAMADPHSLAGLTGIFYSLTYLGFTLPVILAELTRDATYGQLLVGVAAIGLAGAALTGWSGPRGHPDSDRPRS
jgi:hypothetical protein